jgi:hypothetical protein
MTPTRSFALRSKAQAESPVLPPSPAPDAGSIEADEGVPARASDSDSDSNSGDNTPSPPPPPSQNVADNDGTDSSPGVVAVSTALDMMGDDDAAETDRDEASSSWSTDDEGQEGNSGSGHLNGDGASDGGASAGSQWSDGPGPPPPPPDEGEAAEASTANGEEDDHELVDYDEADEGALGDAGSAIETAVGTTEPVTHDIAGPRAPVTVPPGIWSGTASVASDGASSSPLHRSHSNVSAQSFAMLPSMLIARKMSGNLPSPGRGYTHHALTLAGASSPPRSRMDLVSAAEAELSALEADVRKRRK